LDGFAELLLIRLPSDPLAPLVSPVRAVATKPERSGKGSGNDALRPWLQTTKGRTMESRNVKAHRAGHEAFNRRDFGAMVREYTESIRWIDQARGITFSTPEEFKSDFLEGWIRASSDCQVIDATYADAGDTVVARFTGRGTNDGPLGPFPATGRDWSLPMCEMWHFDADGRVVGGEIYYDQVSLLTQLELLPVPA
jgi:ketosteroid isomerase-like protein